MNAISTAEAGLNAEQVAERISAGHANVSRTRTSRSVADIVIANVLTWFNLVLGVLCVIQLVFGSWRDALFGLLLVINAAIGITQELRAKLVLDRLSVISQPKVRVVRDAQVRELPAESVVLDDVVVLAAGEQVVVDGRVLDASGLEIDESAVTGEAVPVLKRPGEDVLSGSFVTAGSGRCVATAVGDDSYAHQVEAAGRAYVRASSDIMTGINKILRTVAVIMVPIAALTLWDSLRLHVTQSLRVTGMVAPLVAMVPEGLVLLSSIAFAVSAVSLARQQVLVNQLPAVEGLARTDVVCSDKTGTLTQPEPAYSGFELLEGSPVDEARAIEALGALVHSDSSPNSTATAIAHALPSPSHAWEPKSSVAFSSRRKWSGIDFAEQGVWVLGAPDVILDCLRLTGRACARAADLSAARKRVLVLATSRQALAPDALPADLVPVGLVILAEQIRPDAAQTVAYLGSQGIAVKLISGDSADTVRAVASAAGVPNGEQAMDAQELSAGSELARQMESTTVFGRVAPQQKSAMVVGATGVGTRGLHDRRWGERRARAQAGRLGNRDGIGGLGGAGGRGHRSARQPFRDVPVDRG